MKPLYSQEQYDYSKSMDKLLCKCYQCDNHFTQLKKYITHVLYCESITFIDSGVYDIKTIISDDEYKVLKDIESKVKLDNKLDYERTHT